MTILQGIEGQSLPIGPEYDDLVRQAARRLTTSLRPRIGILREIDGRPALQGVVGSLRLDAGTALEIAPKVPAAADWVSSVLDLLVGTSRLDIGRDRRAGVSPRRPSLLDVLAAVYAARLEDALRRDGPLLVLARKSARLAVLKGKLSVGEWARTYLTHPTTFPVTFDDLTADNDYTRAMAVVAQLLARATTEPRVRATLLETARALRPGASELIAVPAGAVHRRLPSQWAIYGPAWSITVAILSQRALLGRRGVLSGLEVVVEAWPLLETLLNRSLTAAAQATAAGSPLIVESGSAALLTAISPGAFSRGVFADGRLSDGRDTLATFEAKYSPRETSDWPNRNHVFQALATAAAWQSPLAVLVYPELFDAQWWAVEGFNSKPKGLVAIGLDLFGYESGSGDIERGMRIQTLLSSPPLKAPAVLATARPAPP